jgi:hypothetical protein
MDHIEALITLLHDGMEIFILQDDGLIDKYLGFSIMQLDDSSFNLTQPFLIECITAFLSIDKGLTNERVTPVGKSLLNKDLNGVPCKYDWEYCGMIRMLTYLTAIFVLT